MGNNSTFNNTFQSKFMSKTAQNHKVPKDILIKYYSKSFVKPTKVVLC